MIVNAVKRAEENPSFKEKAEAVWSINGVDKLRLKDFSSEPQLIEFLDNIKCPILLLSPDELLENGTACGEVGNVCFSSKVVNYLKKKKVQSIYTTVLYDKENKAYQIGGAEMDLDEKYSEKLSDMISDLGGSWRDDCGTEDGWSSFESE